MWQWLSVGTLNLIYFGLMGVGILYAIIILVGSGLSHIDLPNIDIHAGDVDIGGVHVPDANVHVDVDSGADVDQGSVGVQRLSGVSIASFITAFGAFGVIALQLLEVDARWSLLVAAGGGLVVAAVMQFAFSYFLLRPQGSSEVRVNDILGAVGEVITPIPAGSVGEIAFIARGARVTWTARSADGSAIARGKLVRVTNLVGSVVIVTPADAPAPQA